MTTAPPAMIQKLNRLKTEYNSLVVNTSRTMPWNSREGLSAFMSVGQNGHTRDYNKIFHYPNPYELTVREHYLPFYLRNGLAARVVNIEPQESWKLFPNITDNEDPKVSTDFQEGLKELIKSLGDKSQIMEGVDEQGNETQVESIEENFLNPEQQNHLLNCLKQVDILSGIGRFGGVFLGFDDGEDPSQPLTKRTNTKLLFMVCLDENSLKAEHLVDNKSDPRHGLPEYYNVTFNNLDDTSATTHSGADASEQKIHHSRIVHIIPQEHSSKVFGIPRQQSVYNYLLDAFRISGSDTEMWWQGAYGGLTVSTIPELGGEAKLDIESVKKQIAMYESTMQRFIGLEAATATRLSPNISDPSPHIESQINKICMSKGYPKRIFMGSERGELASSQDSIAWNGRMDSRCEFHITPNIIAPVINRLIWAGVIPPPTNDGYKVLWPGLTQSDENKQADIAFKRTQAMSLYIASDGDQLINEVDFLSSIIGLDRLEAEEIFERSNEEPDDEDDDNLDLDGSGPQDLKDEE